jgi:hypothetical protein
MADFTTYLNGDVIAVSGGSNAASLPSVTVFQNTYDVARGTVTNGDVCTEFLKIPAGSLVLGVQIKVNTAEAAVTVSVGDAADPDGYVAAQTIAAEGRFSGAGAYLDTAGAKPTLNYYDVDTWLQFTVAGADLTVGEFTVSAAIANMG